MKKINKDKLKKRKDKVKDKKGNLRYIARDSDNPRFITAVYCKYCGGQIQGLNKDNVLVPYWNYSELTMEFDNGTRHITPICFKCRNVENKNDLEAMYIADLEEFEIEDDTDDSVWNYYLDRIPEKPVKEKKL